MIVRRTGISRRFGGGNLKRARITFSRASIVDRCGCGSALVPTLRRGVRRRAGFRRIGSPWVSQGCEPGLSLGRTVAAPFSAKISHHQRHLSSVAPRSRARLPGWRDVVRASAGWCREGSGAAKLMSPQGEHAPHTKLPSVVRNGSSAARRVTGQVGEIHQKRSA